MVDLYSEFPVKIEFLQRQVGSTVLVLLSFLFVTLGYTKYVTKEGPTAIYHQGVIASGYNIFNYAAPLSAMVSLS